MYKVFKMTHVATGKVFFAVTAKKVCERKKEIKKDVYCKNRGGKLGIFIKQYHIQQQDFAKAFYTIVLVQTESEMEAWQIKSKCIQELDAKLRLNNSNWHRRITQPLEKE